MRGGGRRARRPSFHDCRPTMKKPIAILAGLCLITAIGLLAMTALTGALVELDDGRIVAADALSVEGDRVFCRHGEARQAYERKRVRRMADGLPDGMDEIRLRLDYLAGQWTLLSGTWKPSIQALPAMLAARGQSAVLALLGGLLGIGVLVVVGRRWLFRGRLARPAQAPDTQCGASERVCPRLAGLAEVQNHFLELYRCQLGAEAQAEARIEAMEPAPGGPGRSYRLLIFHNGEWRERRMTVSPLGEGTSSRSQCFYVIFDTHLVVKIPPVPINDFSDYRQRLQNEATIASQLGQRPCIIPNVTAILSRIHRFDSPETDPERLEAHYLQWLAANPGHQRHLKIAGAYAFFMDLSRHQFLGQVLAKLAEATGRLDEVVSEDAELVDHPERFEEKYGAANGQLCLELQTLFAVFEERLRRYLTVDGGRVTAREKKGWLLARLAGLPMPADRASQAVTAALRDRLLGDLLADHAPTGAAYRRLVTAEVQRRAFRKGRVCMTALSTNMLDLLAWLGAHRVAMRDLKPDNLLVAGDPKQYPHFLLAADRFVIGLIDVETAVVYPPEDQQCCAQPQLGGTPSYATPSHFFPNAVIASCGGDLGRVLHFQDWYAAAGIIFEIITGRRLFAQTGHLFPGLLFTIRRAAGEGTAPEALFSRFSHQFWPAARAELEAAVAGAAPWLEAVTVELPERMQDELVVQVKGRQAALDRQVDELIASQDVIAAPNQRRDLANSRLAAVQRLIARYREQDSPAARRLLALLQALAHLKQAQAECRSLARVLAQTPARISVKALLPLMFDTVAVVMQPAAGQAQAPDLPPVAPADEAPDGGTLGYTHTVDLPLQG